MIIKQHGVAIEWKRLINQMQHMLTEHASNEQLKAGVAYYQEEGDLDFHYKVILGSHNQQLRAAC